MIEVLMIGVDCNKIDSPIKIPCHARDGIAAPAPDTHHLYVCRKGLEKLLLLYRPMMHFFSFCHIGDFNRNLTLGKSFT
jgi:hypothetical protein